LSGVTSVPSTSARSSRMALSITPELSMRVRSAAGRQVTRNGRLAEEQATVQPAFRRHPAGSIPGKFALSSAKGQ
jgi:hypothetical protein